MDWVLIVGAIALFFATKKLFLFIEIKAAKGNEDEIEKIKLDYENKSDKEKTFKWNDGLYFNLSCFLAVIITLLLFWFEKIPLMGVWYSQLFTYFGTLFVAWIACLIIIAAFFTAVDSLGRFNVKAFCVTAIIAGAIYFCLL